MTEAQVVEIVAWLESELEIARRQLRDLRLSQEPDKTIENPCEVSPGGQNYLSPISRQGEEGENASPSIVRGNARKLSKDRYQRKMGALLLAVNVATELERVITEGRVPWSVALMALGVMTDEIEDKFAAESLSWSESGTSAYANYRGRVFIDEDS